MATAFITGASSGLGKEIALRLLEEGYTVYGAARRVEQMQDLAERGASVLQLDITQEDTLGAAISRVIVESGGIDVLVNNAGFGLYGAVEDTSLADARYQFEVNLFGLARLTQLVLPHMRDRGSGRILNMSSMGGKIYTPLGAWYHASKHALEGWSDCLRLEVAPFGIDVVVIEPGVIRTAFGDTMLGHNACFPDEEHNLGFVAHELTDAPMWKEGHRKIAKGTHDDLSGYKTWDELADYNAKDDRLTAMVDERLVGPPFFQQRASV